MPKINLLRLKFANVLSFKDEQEIFFTAESKYTNTPTSYIRRNAIENELIVPVTAFYGANASGKSNIVKVFTDVILPLLGKTNNKISFDFCKPFLLDDASASRLNKKIRSAAKMVIYTEGDVTEPQYLADWIKKIAVKNSINPIKANMKFNIVPSKDESEPLKVVNNLIENENPIKNNLDIFYAVFDEDDRSLGGKDKENFNKAFEEAENNNVKVICSNRSVELWALMHFSDKTPTTKNELEKELKKYFPKYDAETNKRFDVSLMLDNEGKAIKRAKRLRETNTKLGNWKIRPSTNFDELIEAMKAFIKS